jgi:hypothetical protein
MKPDIDATSTGVSQSSGHFLMELKSLRLAIVVGPVPDSRFAHSGYH